MIAENNGSLLRSRPTKAETPQRSFRPNSLRTVGDVLTRNSSNLAKKFAETRFFNVVSMLSSSSDRSP